MKEAAEALENIKIFYSYAREDDIRRDMLSRRLKPLENERLIVQWYDKKIRGGDEWEREIISQLESSDIILLLISEHFINSEFISRVEVPTALERYNRNPNLVRILPILLNSCNLESFYKKFPQIRDIQFLLDGDPPLTSLEKKETNDAFQKLADEIREIIDIIKKCKTNDSFEDSKLVEHWNLPHPRLLNFIGRKNELETLNSSLRSHNRVALAAIHGYAGIGKTQLAIEYCHYCKEKNTYKVIWWVRAGDKETLSADYADLATSMKLCEKDESEQQKIETVRKWLEQNSKWLLVFDNAENAESLKEYLPTSKTGAVIITSRIKDWSQLAYTITVNLFNEKEAIAFLHNRLNIYDETSALVLAKELGWLPLALEIASAYISHNNKSIKEYLRELEEKKNEILLGAAPPGWYPNSINQTFELSYQNVKQLDPSAAELINLCSFFSAEHIPAKIIQKGIKHLANLPLNALSDIDKLESARATLKRYTLMEISPTNTNELNLAVHRLIQGAIYTRLRNKEPVSLNKYIKASIYIINDAFPEDSDEFKNWEECQSLISHLNCVVKHGIELRVEPDLICKLLNKAGNYTSSKGQLDQAVSAFSKAIKILEEEYGSDNHKLSTPLTNLGLMYHKQKNWSLAIETYNRAIAIDRKAGKQNHPDYATILVNLATTLLYKGEFGKAEKTFLESLKIFRHNQEYRRMAATLTNLGELHYILKHFRKAKAHFFEAYDIDKKEIREEFHPNIVCDLLNIAKVLQALEDLPVARVKLNEVTQLLKSSAKYDYPTFESDQQALKELIKSQEKLEAEDKERSDRLFSRGKYSHSNQTTQQEPANDFVSEKKPNNARNSANKPDQRTTEKQPHRVSRSVTIQVSIALILFLIVVWWLIHREHNLISEDQPISNSSPTQAPTPPNDLPLPPPDVKHPNFVYNSPLYKRNFRGPSSPLDSPSRPPKRPSPRSADYLDIATYSLDLGNNVKLDMITLPGTIATRDSRRPISKSGVRIKPFSIGKSEITVAQWKAVMGDSNIPCSQFDHRYIDNMPVNNVTYQLTHDFISKLREKTNIPLLRLPTEIEWEYAARCESIVDNNYNNSSNHWSEIACGAGSAGKLKEVNYYRNKCGIFDMYGNVFEICHTAGYRETNSSAGARTSLNLRHVLRGGAINSSRDYCNSNKRVIPPYNLIQNIGFRVASDHK